MKALAQLQRTTGYRDEAPHPHTFEASIPGLALAPASAPSPEPVDILAASARSSQGASAAPGCAPAAARWKKGGHAVVAANQTRWPKYTSPTLRMALAEMRERAQEAAGGVGAEPKADVQAPAADKPAPEAPAPAPPVSSPPVSSLPSPALPASSLASPALPASAPSVVRAGRCAANDTACCSRASSSSTVLNAEQCINSPKSMAPQAKTSVIRDTMQLDTMMSNAAAERMGADGAGASSVCIAGIPSADASGDELEDYSGWL